MFHENQNIGLYSLIRKIGQGGFGEVWLAERRTSLLTTEVAIKLPLDEQIDLETVRKEASIWKQASGHPNVLPIIEANVYDNQVVIVSEYAPDGSLAGILKQQGKLPVEKAVEMALGILAGLEFLHSRRIIHRDLKPANVLLQGNTPRLADFGISHALKTTQTSQSVNVAGTPPYMAPEAFDGKRSVQTDIWSVGVILYQLLSGRMPFPQADITSLLGAILNHDPDPLPNLISQSLRDVMQRALAKKPEQRYRSAAEMREDLRKAVEAQATRLLPISPKSVKDATSIVQTKSKAPRRYAIAFFLLVLGVGLGSAIYFFDFRNPIQSSGNSNEQAKIPQTSSSKTSDSTTKPQPSTSVSITSTPISSPTPISLPIGYNELRDVDAPAIGGGGEPFSFRDGKLVEMGERGGKIPPNVDVFLDLPHGLGTNNSKLNPTFNGNGGIIDMGSMPLIEVKEAPKTGYMPALKPTDIYEGHTYCVVTADGRHYGKIYIVRFDDRGDDRKAKLEFAWQYQPNGTTKFE